MKKELIQYISKLYKDAAINYRIASNPNTDHDAALKAGERAQMLYEIADQLTAILK